MFTIQYRLIATFLYPRNHKKDLVVFYLFLYSCFLLPPNVRLSWIVSSGNKTWHSSHEFGSSKGINSVQAGTFSLDLWTLSCIRLLQMTSGVGSDKS